MSLFTRNVLGVCLVIAAVVWAEKSLIAARPVANDNVVAEHPNSLNRHDNNALGVYPFIDLSNGIPPWIQNYNNTQNTAPDPSPKTSYTFSYDNSTTQKTPSGQQKTKREIISYTSSVGGADGSQTTYEVSK